MTSSADVPQVLRRASVIWQIACAWNRAHVVRSDRRVNLGRVRGVY